MRNSLGVFILCAALPFCPTEGTIPSPYDEATPLSLRLEGWYNEGNQHGLHALIKELNAKTVIEVGSWMGLSTVDIAHHLPSDGIVYAVDTWEGSPNETHDIAVLSNLYDQFLSNVIHTGLTEKIVPVRADSVAASKQLSVLADLIYIDATHTYEACYADLQAWYPHLNKKGLMCGDDLFWGDGGVARAVYQFAEEKGLQVYHTGWFWWLKPR